MSKPDLFVTADYICEKIFKAGSVQPFNIDLYVSVLVTISS